MECPYGDETRCYVRRGGYYQLKPEQLESLLKAWKSGETFYDAQGIDGEIETIKLAEVEAVMFCSAESQEAARVKRKAVSAYEEQEWGS
jgi:hypothetical protein